MSENGTSTEVLERAGSPDNERGIVPPASTQVIFETPSSSPEPETRICHDFNDQVAKVILKSSDNMIFFVHDYYLKANR